MTVNANRLFQGLGTTIFEVMSGLAREHGAVNLGQGAPENLEPRDLLDAAAKATLEGNNQYPPLMGTPELRQALTAHERRFYGLEMDWRSEIMVAQGATEALAACFFGLIEPGDEVVLIEPLYDSYLPIVRRAGGVPKLVRLEPPHWDLPRDALAAAFSDRTKLLVLNTPTNPCAKVYDREELAFIAGLLERHDAYAVCDEVYEHLLFDGLPHIPLMTLPGMRRRCLRIGSAGKVFSLTGWKIGYVIADAELMHPAAKAHQFLTFTIAPNLQAAVAYGFGKGDDYFTGLTADMQARRDKLAAGLADIGFRPLPCRGTYFLTVDFSALAPDEDDAAFCRRLVTEAGVAAVPVSAFYASDGPTAYVRFCFAKADTALDEAVARLRRFFG